MTPLLHAFHVERFLLAPEFHVERFGPMAMAVAQSAVAVLWQSALLVLAAWLLLRLVPRLGASARFVVWVTVFAVSATLPFLHLAGSKVSYAVAARQLQLDARWSYALAGLWVVASLLRLAALIVQAVRLRSLWMNAIPVPVPPPVPRGTGTAALSELLSSRTTFVGRHVELCTSTAVDRPSVIGFFAPRILVPAWLYEEMSPVELRHVVLHEMEHLRRRDDWMNLLQKIALVLFPLNPALVWLDRRLAAERELACDDGVLAATHMPRAYAASLASIAERRLQHTLHRRVFALALGALGANGILRGRPEFSRRIEGILDRRNGARPALTGAVAAALVLAVAGVGAVLARSPELVSFAPTAGTTAAATASSGHVLMGEMAARQPTRRMPPFPEARSQNVVFHQATTPLRTKPFAASPAATPTGVLVQRAAAAQPATRPQARPQWFVLTSAGQNTPARVVVRTPDGRYFVAPYAALPVQDGWLILQL
jgi:beta-lactamase regulating signal transducer with metallopeptidase domain